MSEALRPVVTGFFQSPDEGKGMARDFRVRWALEELGQGYDMRFVPFSDTKKAAHLRLHPFGKIPVYQEGALVLFETGAIVLHIASEHAGLLPTDQAARERAIMWMFAALRYPFYIFLFLWSTRVFPFAPTYSSICDEEIRPT